jgi:hypothetical protein
MSRKALDRAGRAMILEGKVSGTHGGAGARGWRAGRVAVACIHLLAVVGYRDL